MSRDTCSFCGGFTEKISGLFVVKKASSSSVRAKRCSNSIISRMLKASYAQGRIPYHDVIAETIWSEFPSIRKHVEQFKSSHEYDSLLSTDLTGLSNRNS